MLLLVLAIAVIIFLGGGFASRGHSTYGDFSAPGIGLGGILLIIVVLLLLTGTLHL